MIWKSTKKMGMSFASRGKCTFVVARYDPPGNVDGKFNENLSDIN